jgi:hypothetical protein
MWRASEGLCPSLTSQVTLIVQTFGGASRRPQRAAMRAARRRACSADNARVGSLQPRPKPARWTSRQRGIRAGIGPTERPDNFGSRHGGPPVQPRCRSGSRPAHTSLGSDARQPLPPGPADHCPELFAQPVVGAVALACKRVADVDRGAPAWAKISLRLALPSSPSIAIARCSITARSAISGYWTDRF